MDVIAGLGSEKDASREAGGTNGQSSGETKDDNERKRENEAATVVQRAWRNHSMKKAKLTSEARWKDTLILTRQAVAVEAASGNEQNSAKARWKRGVFLAGRLQDGDALNQGTEVSPKPEHQKSLETQHWLELVDPKHRYGSNLKYYHQKWQEADTQDNFFRWLDRGQGKGLSLSECSREQLESERIIYLSAEQRLNYLVKIDSDGKLRWERNDQHVDTAPGIWVDAGEGKGIVRVDGSDTVVIRPRKRSDVSSSLASPGSTTSEGELAKHYQGVEKESSNRFIRILKGRFTTNGLMERILRKTVRKNTWLYVSDKNYNVFVGLKETGYFQHSSFTGGGLVTSAGLITVDNGLVTSISPLSGHYRTSIEHFKEFVRVMEERGLDVHNIHVTKGEAMLWGLEHWKAFQKSTKQAKKQVKHTLHNAAHPQKAAEERRHAKEKEEKDNEIAERKGLKAQQEAQHAKATAAKVSSLKPEDVKEQAVRDKIERMRKQKEEEDENWKTGSQWRWEIITGRAQKVKKTQEEKWKSAMEAIPLPSTSTSKQEHKTEEPSKGKAVEGSKSPEAPANDNSASANGIDNLPHHEPEGAGTTSPSAPKDGQPPTPQENPPAYDDSEAMAPPAEKTSHAP